jgi:hypothetical protein
MALPLVDATVNTFWRRLVVTGLLLALPHVSSAQSVDEIVEKHLAAMGGRPVLGKVTSRTTSGRITVTTPVGEISGLVEILNRAPNRVRTFLTLDLSAFGGDKMVYDERFDGSVGYLINTLEGNREVTGNQMHNLRNDTFPTPLLDYKTSGMSLQLAGREKVGDRDAFVLTMTPKLGPAWRRYIDAESYLEIRQVIQAEEPNAGVFELTVDLLDFREVDGIKLPFQIRATSSVQNFTVIVTKVTHNQEIDAALVSRPPETN